MGRTPSTARGIRLPNELWTLIEAEAAASEMSTNELIVRRLRTSFSQVRGFRKTVEKSHEAVEFADE